MQLHQQTRQKGESSKAHQAYLDYREMGVSRSLRKLHAMYEDPSSYTDFRKLPPDSPLDAPTTRLSTIESWSSRWNWQDRLREYEAYLEHQRLEERRQTRLEERKNRDRVLNDFRVQIENQMQYADLSDPEENGKGIAAFNAMTRAIKMYMDMSMKQHNDLPTEKTDLTSAGQQIHVSFTEEVIPQSAIDQRLEALGLASVVEAHE